MVRYPLSVKYSPHHATNTSHVDELAGNETTANDSISGQSQSTDAADDKSQMNSAMLDETSAAVTREQGNVFLHNRFTACDNITWNKKWYDTIRYDGLY